jgi:hypothetical protein
MIHPKNIRVQQRPTSESKWVEHITPHTNAPARHFVLPDELVSDSPNLTSYYSFVVAHPHFFKRAILCSKTAARPVAYTTGRILPIFTHINIGGRSLGCCRNNQMRNDRRKIQNSAPHAFNWCPEFK